MSTFNYYMHGEVRKINLRRGKRKEFQTGGPNEEGYNYTHYRFIHEGHQIRLEIDSIGKDCDGVLESHRDLVCPLSKLASWVGFDNIRFPEWQRVSESQRDQYAEMAGY